MRLFIALAFTASLLISRADAQCSPVLAITGSGQAGTTPTIDLTGGGAHDYAVLLVGWSADTSAVRFGPFGQLTLLNRPFVPVRLGQTDSNGAVSLSLTLPSTLRCTTLYSQGVTTGVNFSRRPLFEACSSNVVELEIGC